jgi:MYXO-CTERM domain-containing protein
MTFKKSAMLMSATAFLACSSSALNAQVPTDTPPKQQTDVRSDRDFDWGWLGLLGLLGLGGLAGRRDVVVGTRRPADRM